MQFKHRSDLFSCIYSNIGQSHVYVYVHVHDPFHTHVHVRVYVDVHVTDTGQVFYGVDKGSMHAVKTPQ